VKIVVKNSSHGPGSYSKSGCMSHGRSARTSLKRLSNPLNVLWSSHSFLTATSFFRCWSTHLKVVYPCVFRMVWWYRSVMWNIEMSAEHAPSPHQTLSILIISLNGKSTVTDLPLFLLSSSPLLEHVGYLPFTCHISCILCNNWGYKWIEQAISYSGRIMRSLVGIYVDVSRALHPVLVFN